MTASREQTKIALTSIHADNIDRLAKYALLRAAVRDVEGEISRWVDPAWVGNRPTELEIAAKRWSVALRKALEESRPEGRNA